MRVSEFANIIINPRKCEQKMRASADVLSMDDRLL